MRDRVSETIEQIIEQWPDYPPQPYWDQLRVRLAIRAGDACEECGGHAGLTKGHAHHTVPLRLGGTNSLSNLEWLCFNCHSNRHSHHLRRGLGARGAQAPQTKRRVSAPITMLQKIDLSISSKKNLRIDYEDAGGKQSSRTIEPIKVLREREPSEGKRRRKWLEAKCLKRGSKRIFGIDRIKAAEIIE